ncbi:hypothetical protein V2S66_31975 [Streptomyces sp. V4-01]|uniref:Type VII secretion protein EccE n=1 Tax=Actinacidiphila polyblastidii TaxID=3110430 RepID=A0ABU7PL52_9ACTN|nr:hypothetical protein [Streptomyces sp. V4-01]
MHYPLIALGVAVNIAASVVAARVAPRRGASAADWSFLALILGPVTILWLLLFGGRNRSRVPWLRGCAGTPARLAPAGRPPRELVLVGALGRADVVRAHRAALTVLRPALDAAHVDAYSGDFWPPEVLPSYEQALALARQEVAAGTRRRRADPGMGIDIDVRDDAQFAVLLDLAAHTIHAEGSSGGRGIFSASDTGTALWIAVTPEQEAELRSQLDAFGIPPTVFAAPPGAR